MKQILAKMYWRVMVLAFLLSGCAHGPAVPMGEEAPPEYQIGREDVLDVSVWRDADLSRTIPVRPDGRISLPLVGELEAAGKTPTILAKEIAARLAPFLEEPKVAVIVREVNASRFFVIGEVIRPGGYPLRCRTTVLQALSVAGGPNEFASKSAIVILRGEKRIEVDYSDLVGSSALDFPLRAGDTIYVP